MSLRRALVAGVGLVVFALLVAAPGAGASFGVKSVSMEAVGPDGATVTQAGAHPYLFQIKVVMNQNAGQEPEGTLRRLDVNLPAGLVGDPRATPLCRRDNFEEPAYLPCPNDTQVGTAEIFQHGLPPSKLAVNNLVAPNGFAASIGFTAVGLNSFENALVRNDDYGVTISDDTVPTSVEIQSVTETVWGVPGDPGHQLERLCGSVGKGAECPAELASEPFLTLPTSCGAALTVSVQAESLQEPGVLTPPVSGYLSDSAGDPVHLAGCEKLAFSPTIDSSLETKAADSPTGLRFDLHVPQPETVHQVENPHEARNEVQSVAFLKGEEGDSVRLGFQGHSTAELFYGASAQEVQEALEALPSIRAGNVRVSGGNGSPYIVEFVAGMAEQNVPQLEALGEDSGVEVKTLVQGIEKKSGSFGYKDTEPGLASANLRDAQVTLPAGLVVDPSSADGLGACSEAQIGYEGMHEEHPVFSGRPAECPENSKLGTVEVDTPLLDHALPGAVYLASQDANPFGSLIALYVVVDDPVTGVIVKLAGRVEVDPVTGRLTTVFKHNPQLPFEDLKLDLSGGPRAPLTTPFTCGDYTTTSDMTPWTSPEGADAFPSSSFAIDSGPGGSGCVADEAQAPNAPGLEAGTTLPVAGSYSPFVLKLSRENGSQRFADLSLVLPLGLVGKIAGVEQCSDASLQAAAARVNEGEGALEIAHPSCPAASEVGTVHVGAGSGTPMFVTGHAYLAGPYEGAPFSLAIVTPAVAGPFDLGSVVVRAGLYIDRSTAQVTVKSGPFPTILHGIPLDIRRIEVDVSRTEFTLNPTSCEPTSVAATETSTTGATAALSNRFQVGDCSKLAFKPSFTVSTAGKTSRSQGASLHVKLTYPKGSLGNQANIARVRVELPKALPSRLTTLNHACTDKVFDQNPAACPPESRVGYARASTPILPVPVEGPAYFVSHGGQKFPELILVLQGDGVTIYLQGETFISKAGITSSTFKQTPDVPVSTFELNLPQGKYSALGANRDLCASTLAMPTSFTAQNGALLEQSTQIEVTGCPYALRVLSHTQHSRTVTLTAVVPAAGRLQASGAGLTTIAKTTSTRQVITLSLKQRNSARLRTSVLLRFTPSKGKQRKVLRKTLAITLY